MTFLRSRWGAAKKWRRSTPSAEPVQSSVRRFVYDFPSGSTAITNVLVGGSVSITGNDLWTADRPPLVHLGAREWAE